MHQTGLTEESVLFSLNRHPSVNALLQAAAVAASRSDKTRAEQLFAQAFKLDTACLQSYYALYKFYFYQVWLQEVVRQGRFSANYRQLYLRSLQWSLYADEIPLLYLYTLQALAFIDLRQRRFAEDQMILRAMAELDPEERSGASVARSLADALAENNS